MIPEPLERHEPDAILDETVPARRPWSHILRRGEVLRIVDLHGQQAVDALFWRAGHPAERYSAQDTLRVGGRAYLGTGSRLISNEGRPMLTLIADTSGGRHDTCAGCCSCESNTVRFGHETRYMHACRENFITELARHGMGKRDIVSNVNFFMNVPITPDGEMAVDDGISPPGGMVDLQAHMDVLVVLSNCPQMNNPCNGFDPTPIRVLVWAVRA
jgi:urea carboxylase-associated protein 1